MALACEYNTVILGSGISESIVSSALARVHKRVLHLDNNSYYADAWATKTLTDFVLWLSRTSAPEHLSPPVEQEDGSMTQHLFREDHSIHLQDWYWAPRLRQEMEVNHENLILAQEPVKPDIRGDRPSLISLHHLVNQNRRFNVDITPKLMFNNSKIMEALSRTGLGFYSDFQKVSKCLHLKKNGRIIQLPYDLATIASSSKLTEDEKENISNFFHWIQTINLKDETQIKYCSERSLKEILIEKKILSNFAMVTMFESFAFSKNTVGGLEGITRLKKYLSSLSEDAGSALSWIHYGSMELAETFCRHSAVWGTTFILRRSIESLIIRSNRVVSVILTSGDCVRVDHLIINARFAPLNWIDESKIRYLARAVYFTDAPLRTNARTDNDIGAEGHQGVSIFSYRLEGYSEPVRILELPTSVRACPPNTWMVHMSLALNYVGPNLPDTVSPRGIFQQVANYIFTDDEDNMSKPHSLLSAFFVIRSYTEAIQERSPNLPQNVFLTPGPDTNIDYDSNVQFSSRIFEAICNNEQFLPPTPTVSGESQTSETSTSLSNEI